MKEENKGATNYGTLVGTSAAMQQVYAMIDHASATSLPVLISGESGTGKELVAQEIHRRSTRKNGPFVPVNTGALPPELVASELFGHVPGAFTGALNARKGWFVEAAKGTLFLDEVATMSKRTQVALLRVIEEGACRPVGGESKRRADARLIAASNTDLHEAAAAGRFREDLLFRLNVMTIHTPSLQDRMEDLSLLVPHFLETANASLGLSLEGIAPEAITLLEAYPWPGNVRELRNAVMHAAVMAEEGIIEPKHLPPRVSSPDSTPEAGAPQREAGGTPKQEFIECATNGGKAVPQKARPILASDETGVKPGLFFQLGSSLHEIERAYVLHTLAHSASNRTQAAKMLGIGRKTLYDRLKRWGAEGS